MNIENDKTSVIRKNVPYILDQDLNTCITLPLSGDSPPLLWLRFTKLSLVRVTSHNFKVRVTGDGIECARIGPKQLMVGVSGPCHNTRCSVDSDLVFCKFVASTTVNTLTRCELQCKCPSPSRCTDVQIVLISNNHDDWSLCEISMEDV
ncbi:uncharacterized protein [Argopecten irradians]|uniref:uncharacterized protein n=1 Tax=Argopecten irradians TaxID=31199 RepID=UPI0037202725